MENSETVTAREIEDWFGVSDSSAFKFTREADFPAPVRVGAFECWSRSAVADWHSRHLDEIEQTRIEDAADAAEWDRKERVERERHQHRFRVWRQPWAELTWWQKPIQALYAATRGVAEAVGGLIMLILYVLVALIAAGYLYKMWIDPT